MQRLLVAFIVLLVLAVGGWFVFGKSSLIDFDIGSVTPRLLGEAPAIESDYVVPGMEDTYRSEKYKFSLTMPEGFHAGELPVDENGGEAILFQDATGNGIQIYVMPYAEETKVLTAEMIRSSIPDMQVASTQEVELSDGYRGVAFISDNEAFGGQSREVWFIFRGNLYQVSTYARLDPLLQAMFSTWKFY